MKKYFYLCISTLLILLSSCSSNPTDNNTEPTFTLQSRFTAKIDENPKKDAVVATIKVTTSENLTITYSILSQKPTGAFALDASSGELKVADPSLFDYEKNKELTANIEAKSGSTKAATSTFILTLVDVNENTIEAPDFTATIDENPKKDDTIGSIKAGGSVSDITYTLENIDPAGAISIGASTGEIKVSDPSLFDFETRQTVSATAKLSGGGITKKVKVSITIKDVDE